MAKFLVSAFSDEYSDCITEQCAALNGFGIEYTELRGVNGKNVAALTKDEIKSVKQTLTEYGVKVSAIGSPLGKISIGGDMAAHYETAKRIFETANELGTKNVRIFSFYLPDGKTRAECKGRVFAGLEKLAELAGQAGVTLCHENEALIYGESPESCLEIAEHFGGRIKCVLDMGNFVLDGYDPEKAYFLLQKHIEYFHIKDALFAGAIVPAGKGEAKIKEILDDYKAKAKKDAFITLEPHLQTFSGLNALVGKKFDNPYKYENQREAFTDAVAKLKELL